MQIFDAEGTRAAGVAVLRDLPPLVGHDWCGRPRRRAPLVTLVVGGRPGRAAVLRAEMRESATPSWSASSATRLTRIWPGWRGCSAWCGPAASWRPSALGYWLASRALAPVVGISRRAARIAQGEFAARLDPPARQDEVGEMTQSLNEVLERLHGALEAHRRFASDASHELRAPHYRDGWGDRRGAEASAHRGGISRDLAGGRRAAVGAERLCEDLMLLVHAQEGAQGSNCARSRCCRSCGGARRACRCRCRPATSPSKRANCRTSWPTPIRGCWPASSTTCSPMPCTTTATAERRHQGRGEGARSDEWKPARGHHRHRHGAGHPADESERVFDRFYRLDPVARARTGGSGLGLAICREVMAVFGGSIRIAASSTRGDDVRDPGARTDRVGSPLLASAGGTATGSRVDLSRDRDLIKFSWGVGSVEGCCSQVWDLNFPLSTYFSEDDFLVNGCVAD